MHSGPNDRRHTNDTNIDEVDVSAAAVRRRLAGGADVQAPLEAALRRAELGTLACAARDALDDDNLADGGGDPSLVLPRAPHSTIGTLDDDAEDVQRLQRVRVAKSGTAIGWTHLRSLRGARYEFDDVC